MSTGYGFNGQYSYAGDFGLLYFNARWVYPVLGRFTQADTIVPAGVQGYDRYAFVNNNPVRYTDPSGHWPWPSGNQIQFNIAIGITLQTSNLSHPSPNKTLLLFWSLSLVTDKDDGVQFYSTTRDQTYQDGTSPSGSGFKDGPAEKANPSEALTAGWSLSYGTIEGEGFKTTEDYKDYAVDTSFGVSTPLGNLGGDRYVYADPVTGQTDPSHFVGTDINILSSGAPFGYYNVATNSQPLFGMGCIPLPIVLTAWCKVAGMCGSLPGAGPASEKDMPENMR
ncbi:MAG: RHS repeat-associated core domain-containing protein [Anaerolineales bacterium]|nr:RHS repeat-associated core domain-containing protein [Anaerolineales bacterium]